MNRAVVCSQFQSVSSGKRKLEVDVQQLTQEHEELQTELRAANDKAKKSACEVQSDTPTQTHSAERWCRVWRCAAALQTARVLEELRVEQEHIMHLERVKKSLELQMKDMSGRLEEAEQMAMKGGKKIIQKLEGRVNIVNLMSGAGP